MKKKIKQHLWVTGFSQLESGAEKMLALGWTIVMMTPECVSTASNDVLIGRVAVLFQREEPDET